MDPLFFFKWILICLVYIVYKLLPDRNKQIFYFIIITGVMQPICLLR